MIKLPANHPGHPEQREALREKLLPAAEREELVRRYGELILPELEKLLDAKIDVLASRYEEGWRDVIETLKDAADLRLVTREQVAEMLGISLSSVQRLEKRGDLPEPERFGSRVRHNPDAIVAFAKRKGLQVHALPKKQP